MAQVDFSNAVIEPYLYNPTVAAYLSLNNATLYSVSSSTTRVVRTDAQVTQVVNERKQLTYMYQGTFNQSGTGFLVRINSSTTGVWKVSNISFDDGDTYVFQINATLVCN